jgi:hypothetical protein
MHQIHTNKIVTSELAKQMFTTDAYCPFCNKGRICSYSSLQPPGILNITIRCYDCDFVNISSTSTEPIDENYVMDKVYEKYNQHKIDIWRNLK